MKIARFDRDGGPITSEVTCEPQRDGAYQLKLWAANDNAVLERWPGNFMNTADDEHEMPTPAATNDGRIVEVVATVAVPPGTGPSRVSLVVRQDGQELARDHSSVPPDTPTGLANVFIRLEAAP